MLTTTLNLNVVAQNLWKRNCSITLDRDPVKIDRGQILAKIVVDKSAKACYRSAHLPKSIAPLSREALISLPKSVNYYRPTDTVGVV